MTRAMNSLAKLSEILFEGLDDLVLVDLDGCDEGGFEVYAGDIEFDCGEISDDLYRLFGASGIRVMSNESAYSALIDSTGRVYGGLVVSKELPQDYDEFEHGNGVITFSVVVDPSVRGNRLAQRLIENLLRRNRRSLVRAQVINPVMEKILVGMGFEKVSESGSAEGLVYQWKR